MAKWKQQLYERQWQNARYAGDTVLSDIIVSSLAAASRPMVGKAWL
jgi:hypothetical protein